MTTRYVGSGGSDGAAGTSWGARKATLTGVEATVAAGDTVYVGPGTYRETLTCSTSGTGGNPITYNGDYMGTNTDGVGGLVRITGSDDDLTATRSNNIVGTSINYRTFNGFQMDLTTTNCITQSSGSGTNWVINQCLLDQGNASGTTINLGAGSTTWTISNCVFRPHFYGATCIYIANGTQINSSAIVISNCIFLGATIGVQISKVGDVTVKNCSFLPGCGQCILVSSAVASGHSCVVNNCIFQGASVAGVQGTATTDITEDYNAFFGNLAHRTNTSTGTHSNNYPMFPDPRPYFQIFFAGAGSNNASQVVSPYDLASFSQLINVAGTSPTSTDLRGTATLGAQREWGAMEYDSTLKIKDGRLPAAKLILGIGQ